MSMDENDAITIGPTAPRLQRKCVACEADEEDEATVQPKRDSLGPAGPANVATAGLVHDALGSPAHPLSTETRSFFESRFGRDLSAVRVHTGPAATGATTAINARAFTVGNDIAFAPNEFRPATPSGQRLLAHELTHVAQQAHASAPVVRRQPKPTTPPWQQQLDDILPKNVGLIAHMDRIGQLMDRFNEAELTELVGLIHADSDATAFVRTEAGVPGIFALQETRVGQHLDVAAARTFVDLFPTRRRNPRKSDDTKREVYSEAVVRDAYIRFHANALLPHDESGFSSDMPHTVRRNCIAIVHDMLPQLFTSESAVKQIKKRLAKLRAKGQTYTMVHTGDALADAGVSGARKEIPFKDAAGKETNGNTEPAKLSESAWTKVMSAVGSDFGWHIFGMAIMDGYHSVTLFVDNQPEGKRLYWADQWEIEAGDDFKQVPGAISGFREYKQKGFDEFIEAMTNDWWKDVHTADSKCGKAHPKNWDSACRYNATLMLWHLRKSAAP